MRAILDAHPDLAVPGESYFPVWLARQRNRYERLGGFDSERYINDLLSDPWFQKWELSEAAVRAAMAAAPPVDFPDSVRRTFAAYARSLGKTRYGDKTPTFVLHIPQLAKLFPEARFVHLVRDGRDTALSLLDVGWGPDRFDQAALHWRAHVRAGRRAGSTLGVDRYLEVRYEQLSTDAEPVIRRLCEFLELTFEPSMLRYYENTDQLIRSLPNPEEHQNLTRPPARMRDWRTHLTDDQVALFALLAGDELSEFSYELAAGSPTLGTRAVALAARARWHTRQTRRKGKSLVARALKRPDKGRAAIVNRNRSSM